MMNFLTGDRHPMRIAGALALVIVLAGCDDGFQLPFGQGAGGGGASASERAGSTRLVERDVEAPEVFQVTDQGLWDGRPSLGGVWVAHPDATDPERVIIRNEANGRFVIGALFRRERDNPGPVLQVSSDAAAALNMVAGAPTELNVTALRREEVTDPEPTPAAASAAPTGEIETTTIDPISAAAAAIDAAEAEAETSAPAPQTSSLDRPYIQIGIFSVEANAERTAQTMRDAGLTPIVHEQTSSGRDFWRVVIGPAQTTAERNRMRETVRGLGFADAYFVTN
ncbi:SPOR domain-containing protein [Nioella aestuarii]|uniref:SPOR domain-containing protein n=1 Tax=Nioella aestuarii TaxID=1662864 RepID=UPI003D7F6C0C